MLPPPGFPNAPRRRFPAVRDAVRGPLELHFDSLRSGSSRPQHTEPLPERSSSQTLAGLFVEDLLPYCAEMKPVSRPLLCLLSCARLSARGAKAPWLLCTPWLPGSSGPCTAVGIHQGTKAQTVHQAHLFADPLSGGKIAAGLVNKWTGGNHGYL